MSDTIFYNGRLKRGKKPQDVFERIAKCIKKKGPAKEWRCTIEEGQFLRIDFPDGMSESFMLQFDEKGEFDDFCKVYFPLEGDLFEDGKSEFKALLDILYKVKSKFCSIKITDDYGLAESYWDSKRFKCSLRTLTPEEDARVRRLYSAGNTTHEQLLRSVMAEDMEMSVEELYNYKNIDIYLDLDRSLGTIAHIAETYLYETAAFRKEGRLCETQEYYSLKYNFALFAFAAGMSWVFFDGTGSGTEINLEKRRIFGQKDAQVGLLFREKFAPLFMEQRDPLERCILAYRYFESVFDYLGFIHVGKVQNLKTVMEQILEEYGKERGEIYLTCYCTTERYVFKNFDLEKKKIYADRLVKNMRERYGEDFFREYVTGFKRKYEENSKFRQETRYMARTKERYIDDSLVL